ncbi:MAG: 5-formyltetrahydrofolate cyclo-ligase [Clostridiales bacterium]|nr:5-formyltetrahydrofolate cyclo-ligase [Clostridiales bacterium]
MDERKEYICKARVRSELRDRRAHIADKPALSKMATEHILPLLRGNVLVYASIADELCTTDLINALFSRADVQVFAPFTVNGIIMPRRLIKLGKADRLGNLADECYSKENDSEVKIDVCVTPLLGFDSDGYRLGYGKGCYDRFFVEHDTFKMGLAFDAQRAEFSHEAHDIPLDCCVTESGVIYFNRNACNIG